MINRDQRSQGIQPDYYTELYGIQDAVTNGSILPDHAETTAQKLNAITRVINGNLQLHKTELKVITATLESSTEYARQLQITKVPDAYRNALGNAYETFLATKSNEENAIATLEVDLAVAKDLVDQVTALIPPPPPKPSILSRFRALPPKEQITAVVGAFAALAMAFAFGLRF